MRVSAAAVHAPTVHVIDDDDAIRDSLARLLRLEDIAVRKYASAQDFLDVLPLEAEGGGCVISDVQMPGMDGIELLRQLQGRAFELPVILMSGRAGHDSAARGLGAADFVEKPFAAETVLTAIRQVIYPEG